MMKNNIKKKSQKISYLNGRILEYRKTHTLKDTGIKFNLTSERIRQIQFLSKRKRCLVHNRYFHNRCAYCIQATSYKRYVNNFEYFIDIVDEAHKEAKNKKRDYLSVQRKVYLAKRLHEGWNVPIPQLAIIFDRDRTTIINLLNKAKNI